MKPARAFLACSLLASLWLASCSGNDKKPVMPAEDAGEGGEATGGAAGSSTHAGTGGTSSGSPSAGEAGEAGASTQGGTSGQAGAGGEGSELACFDGGVAAAGASGFDLGEGGASGAIHLKFSCDTLKAALAPTYDPVAGTITLDTTPLGPVTGGSYTYYSEWSDGENNGTDCSDETAQNTGSQLVLPFDPAHTTSYFRITALSMHDECGNDAVLSSPTESGIDCFNLQVSNYDDAWQIDCYEGACQPTCQDDTSI